MCKAKVLCAILLFILTSSLHASLVAHYTFEGNTHDISGNGHHGTMAGGVSLVNDSRRGNVLDCTNGFVDIHLTVPLPAFAANTSITLAAWVKQQTKSDGSGNYNYIIQLGSNGDNPIATLNILASGGLNGYSETDQPGSNADQVAVTSSVPIEAGAPAAFADWHHLAVVYDRTTDTGYTYIDGVQSGTTDISLMDDTYGFTWANAGLGGNAGGSPYFDGLLDDVRIYDEVLDANDIADIIGTRIIDITPTSLQIDEGLSDSYVISLPQDPNQVIQISIIPEDVHLSVASGAVTGNPGEAINMTFNSSNWQTPQTVTVTAVDDGVYHEGIIRTISHSVDTIGYSPVSDVEVTIVDDDYVEGCGDWGYLPMDFNKDCYVNLGDLAEFVQEWLACTDPAGIDCSSIEEFTIIVLPDTQYYSQSYPQHFNAQTQWIVDNVDALNIKYVLHLGDITNNNNTTEFNNAKTALSTLDGVVPYALASGNHDYGPGGNASARDTLFINSSTDTPSYFGTGTAYATQPTIGGFYSAEPGQTDNSWHTFNAAGEDFLIIALEWGPRDAVVDWAETVVAAHPNHHAILITHAYMYSDETRYDWATKGASQSWNPHAYGTGSLAGGTNDGEELWQKLVKKYPNFIMTLNGHVLNDGAARLTSIGDHGNSVHQMLCNYQTGVTGSVEGGQGYLRIYTFKPDKETVDVKTYSPVLGQYKTDAQQEFTLTLSPAL